MMAADTLKAMFVLNVCGRGINGITKKGVLGRDIKNITKRPLNAAANWNALGMLLTLKDSEQALGQNMSRIEKN